MKHRKFQLDLRFKKENSVIIEMYFSSLLFVEVREAVDWRFYKKILGSVLVFFI